jgi:hypothetical protein
MSDQTATLQLILDLKARTDELRKGQQELLAFKNTADSINTGLGAIGKGFAAGLGIGGALSVVGAIKSTISEAVGEMKALVTEGLNFNKVAESAQVSIAGVLRNFQPERFKTFNEAMQGSGEILDQLKAKSLAYGLSFETIADQYRATFGAMLHGGITDTQKQIDLITTMQRVMQAYNITGARATRDIIDLLIGRTGNLTIAKELGVSSTEIENAIKAGQAYEFWTQKLSGFTEMANAANNTTLALEERLKQNTAQVAASQTGDLTQAYRGLLVALTDLVNSDGFKGVLKLLSAVSTDVINKTRSLVDAFTINDPNKAQQERSAGNSADITNATSADALLAARRRATVQKSAAQSQLDEFLTTKGRSTIESPYGRAEIANYKKLIADAEEQIKRIEQQGAAIVAKNAVKAQADAAAEQASRVRIAEEEAGKELEKQASKFEVLKSKLDLVGTKDEERLATLKQIVAEIDKQYEGKKSAATGPKQIELLDFQKGRAELPFLQQIAAVEQQIAREKERQAKAILEPLEAQRKADEQEDARYAVELSRSVLSDLDAKKAAIRADYTKTETEKRRETLDVIKEESAAIDEIIASLRTLSANTGDDAAKNQIGTEISRLQGRQKKIPAEKKEQGPVSLSDQVNAGIASLENGFTTAGQAISNTMDQRDPSEPRRALEPHDEFRPGGRQRLRRYRAGGAAAARADGC